MRWSALIALSQSHLPEFADVARFVATNFDDVPDMLPSGSTACLFTCTIGGFTAAVTLIDRPIPWSQLEGPYSTAWYWPTAASDLKDHPAHLLVVMVDEPGKSVEKSILLTQLVAGLVANSPAQGVFWGPGRMVHEPQAFLDQAAQLTAVDLPLFIWIDFRVERVDEQLCRLYTTGLQALGHLEIEIPQFRGDPQRMLEYAYNIAHYQLRQQKEIHEGDTIALTEQVHACATRGPSMLDHAMEVVQLAFP